MNDSNPQAHGRPGLPFNAGGARRSTSPNRAHAAAHGVSRLRSAAPLLMVGVAVSTTGGSAFAVQLFSTLGPIGTLWIRNLLAALILLVLAGRSFRLPPRDQLFRLAALGVVLAACNASFYGALDRVPLSVAATVEFLGPLAVAVAGTRHVADLAWAALAAVGVVLLASPTSALDPIGLLLALAAGACWAIYILLSKRLVHELGPVLTISGAFVVSALALTPFALPIASAILQWHVAGAALAVAVFSAGLPYLLELVALRLMPASTFSILLSLEPAAAALMGLAILGQRLGPVELLAIALVVIASAGANWRAGRADTKSPPIADSAAPLPLAPAGLHSRLVYAFTSVRLLGRLRERSPP
jgi:inner membrane transporter RhtA